jgi:hypothetical protein
VPGRASTTGEGPASRGQSVAVLVSSESTNGGCAGARLAAGRGGNRLDAAATSPSNRRLLTSQRSPRPSLHPKGRTAFLPRGPGGRSHRRLAAVWRRASRVRSHTWPIHHQSEATCRQARTVARTAVTSSIRRRSSHCRLVPIARGRTPGNRSRAATASKIRIRKADRSKRIVKWAG